MQQKYYETKEFMQLQRKWYSVLKAEGFTDIETLKDIRTGNVNKQIIKVDFESVRHFEKCSLHLHSGEITDKLDLLIFEQYCQGYTNSKSAKSVIVNFKSLDRSTITYRILKILKKAKIEPITFNF